MLTPFIGMDVRWEEPGRQMPQPHYDGAHRSWLADIRVRCYGLLCRMPASRTDPIGTRVVSSLHGKLCGD